MVTTHFQIGDYVRVTKSESRSRIPVRRLTGHSGRIVQIGGTAALAGGQYEVLFKVELNNEWHGANRRPLIPADVLEITSPPEADTGSRGHETDRVHAIS